MERSSPRSLLEFNLIDLLPIIEDGNADQGHDGPGKSTSAHAAIDSLPPELLSKIFLVCAALCIWPIEGDNRDFTCGDYLPWIAIAQVSRYWRSVALGCGELWRGLLFSSPKATSEMLRRSKGVSLVVKASSSLYSDICDNVRMVIPEIERVSVLHLCFPANLLQPLLHDIFVASPKLVSLRLKAKIGSIFFFDPPFIMPDTILTRLSPSLRYFELTHCQFSWQSLPLQSLLLQGLTHLELRKPASRPTTAQLTSLLCELSMLDTLVFDRVLPTHKSNTNSGLPSSRQFFPYLRVLTLSDTLNACTYFLGLIAYPITTISTIDCEILSGERSKFHKLFLEARSAAGFSVDHTIHSFAVGENTKCLVLKCLAVQSSSPPPDPSLKSAQLNISMNWDDVLRRPLSKVLRTTIGTLPLGKVRALQLSNANQTQLQWTEFLRHLPMTHTIYFVSSVPTEFIRAIADVSEWTMAAAGLTANLLPLLRSIHFDGVDWEGPWMIRTFLACLKSRMQVGLPVTELHFRDCVRLYRTDVEKMSGLVQDVDWDKDYTGRDFEIDDYD